MPLYQKIDPETNKVLEYTNPITWWNQHCLIYPTIAELASRVLPKPATSAPAERVFSGAGITIANDRASILPENAQSVVYLRDNHEVVTAYLKEIRK